MSKPRILLVEDNQDIRELLVDSLKSMGWNVTEAEDGSDAITKFWPGGFDVVSTDGDMPKIGGLKLAQAIRTVDKNVGIVLLSGETPALWPTFEMIGGNVAFLKGEGLGDYLNYMHELCNGLKKGSKN